MTMTHKPTRSSKSLLSANGMVATCLAASLFIISPQLLASGGGGSFGSTNSSRVDKQYELGRSFYKSRQANGSQLKYCVQSGSELKKLSRRSVKKFKNGSVSAFVDSLYSCADPNLKIADLVPVDQGNAILYYLNKRYKLRLKS